MGRKPTPPQEVSGLTHVATTIISLAASNSTTRTNPTGQSGALDCYADMEIYTELYDPKVGRKLRQIPFGGKCNKCGEWHGHKIDCDEVDTEQLYRIAKSAQHSEEHARERADRYWKMLQQYQGKLATLKHENNTLRKANERLRAEKST